MTGQTQQTTNTGNINLPIKLLKSLKHGKRVIIPNIDKRYAIMGMLEVFGIQVKQDGAFISLAKEDGESHV